jgi:hypothetical protein
VSHEERNDLLHVVRAQEQIVVRPPLHSRNACACEKPLPNRESSRDVPLTCS